MKKKLFTLLLCAFAVVSANAYTVTDNGDGSVTIDGGAAIHTTWTDNQGLTHTEINGTPNVTNEYGEVITRGSGLPNQFTAAEMALINGASKLIFTGYIDNMLAFQNLDANNNITEVDMKDAQFQQNRNSVETVTYLKYNPSTKETSSVTRTYLKNVMAFHYFKKMSKVTLPENYLESICMKTFDANYYSEEKDENGNDIIIGGLTSTFEIPTCVRYIAQQAVINTPITSITIPDNVEYINYQGFQNAKIRNLIDVTVEGYTAAANGAFDKQTTVGQTDAEYANYATLHFPEGAEEYFQNMEHKLDQGTSLNAGKFQAWLDQHYTAASNCSSPNGWKEFMNAGSGDPEDVPEGTKVVLRTFSDNVARLVPIGFRAYLVTGATKGSDGNYTVALQQIFAIPAYTGVILYGEVKPNESSYTLSHIKYWDPGQSDYVTPYNRISGIVNDAENKPVTVKNYMVPTVEQTTLYPFYKGATSIWDAVNVTSSNKDNWVNWPLPNMKSYYNSSNTGTVSDRNFILSNLKSTTLKGKQTDDYVGLFRVIANTKCGPNKAYLSLPADVFDSPAGAEALVVKPTGTQEFRSDEWNTPFPTPGNWGQRGSIGVLEAKFAGEIFEEETGIQSVATESVDDGCYTLQGVRVAQPQKGVYVKNGKKVIIK